MTMSSKLLALLPLIGGALASALGSNSTIHWGACAENFTSALPLDCGQLSVPLDYTRPNSSQKLTLELLRVPTVVKPARGSIFLNFGGPGLASRSSLASLSLVLQALSGGRYNLIAFDPRGTGSTMPFTCGDDLFKMQLFWERPILPGSLEDEAPLGQLWARSSHIAQVCAQTQNETGSLIGTAFSARDIVRVAESLGENGLVRYWGEPTGDEPGFSYGTTLGATLVSIFPHKVDKIVLDGVQNAYEYYNADVDFEEWTQSDQVFSGIFKSCLVNSDKCALARRNQTAKALEKSAWDLVDRLRRRPVAVGSQIVDDSFLRSLFAISLYTTMRWEGLAMILDMLMSGTFVEKKLKMLIQALGDAPNVTDVNVDLQISTQTTTQLALLGIHCGDRAVRPGTLDRLLPSLPQLFGYSKVMGGPGYLTAMACAQWKIEPKERYQGDFHVRPRNPVLIIGNTYDGHTPIRSAYNLSSSLENSVVLKVNGYGNTSLGLPSMCSLKTVSQYWLTGSPLEPGTVCQVDSPPFSNITWLDVINKTNSGNTSVFKRDTAYEQRVVVPSFVRMV